LFRASADEASPGGTCRPWPWVVPRERG